MRPNPQRAIKMFLFTSLAATGACAEPSPMDFDPSGTSGPINVTSTTAYEDGGGVDETGGAEEPDVVNGCRQTPEPNGLPGWQHQCAGVQTINVSFDVQGVAGFGPQAFGFNLLFGHAHDDDSYEKPKVMACCEPFDEEGPPHYQQPHQRACYHDFVENGCRSIPARLYELEKDAPPIARPQIRALAKWFAEHSQDCYEQFWIESGASTFVADSSVFFDEPHTWVLPASAETLNFKDIEVELTIGAITAPFLPEDVEDRILCDSAQDNNDVMFIVAEPEPGYMYDLLEGDIELEGTYDSNPLGATADLASFATNCTVCSYLGFTAATGAGGPRLDALVLESEEQADLRWDPSEILRVDRFRVALYDAVAAPLVERDHWEIAQGAAHFLVSGIGPAGSGALSMYNATPIDIRYVTANQRYEIDPFELQYEDSDAETWTITVSSTDWN